MKIRPSILTEVIAHAQACQPQECCGVLLGKDGEITQAIRAVNLAESTSRFLLDPKAHIDARRTARAQGLDVVGFYHSHPHSQAYPSPADLAEAAYPECVHLIVGFVEGKPEARLFNYTAGAASELTVLSNS
jgi:proteasome lid subunit RPN8/RPN11